MSTLLASASIYILSITLASAPTEPTLYEFNSKADCEAVQPVVKELYLALGESWVKMHCSASERETPALSLKANMILSL